MNTAKKTNTVATKKRPAASRTGATIAVGSMSATRRKGIQKGGGAANGDVVTNCIGLVGQATAAYGATYQPQPLTPKERKGVLRPARVWNALLPQLYTLWQQYGGEVRSASFADPAPLMAHVADDQALLHQLDLLRTQVNDDLLTTQQSVVTSAQQIYKMLQALGRTNPKVKVAIAPVALALKRVKKAAATPGAPVTKVKKGTKGATGTAAPTPPSLPAPVPTIVAPPPGTLHA